MINTPLMMVNLNRSGIWTDIFIESVHKPDAALRQCAHNQKCYHELMDVLTEVLNHLKSLRWH